VHPGEELTTSAGNFEFAFVDQASVYAGDGYVSGGGPDSNLAISLHISLPITIKGMGPNGIDITTKDAAFALVRRNATTQTFSLPEFVDYQVETFTKTDRFPCSGRITYTPKTWWTYGGRFYPLTGLPIR
jgi:hypothetical protein